MLFLIVPYLVVSYLIIAYLDMLDSIMAYAWPIQ